jgi:hypothetical protein
MLLGIRKSTERFNTMRCDQNIGLNDRATAIINCEIEKYKINVIVKGVRIYPDGKEVPFEQVEYQSNLREEICGEYEGFDKHTLCKYVLPNNDVYEEYVQDTHFSSGPMFFLALKKNGEIVQESLWTDEEIKTYCE